MAPLPLDRRTFLTLAAVGLAAPGAILAAVAPGPGSAKAQSSVGFVVGSSEWERLAWPAWSGEVPPGSGIVSETGSLFDGARGELEVVVASKLPLGDQDFAGRSVRLRIRGLYPEAFPLRGERVRSAFLEILWPSSDPLAPAPIPVFAWSFRRGTGTDVAPPVVQTVPVGPDGRLDLRLRLLPTALGARELGVPAGLWQERLVSFTVDWQEGQPKLQRGAYLVGLTPQQPWDVSRVLPGEEEKAGAELRSIVLLVEAAETDSQDE
jgi:hypothetical protein